MVATSLSGMVPLSSFLHLFGYFCKQKVEDASFGRKTDQKKGSRYPGLPP